MSTLSTNLFQFKTTHQHTILSCLVACFLCFRSSAVSFFGRYVLALSARLLSLISCSICFRVNPGCSNTPFGIISRDVNLILSCKITFYPVKSHLMNFNESLKHYFLGHKLSFCHPKQNLYLKGGMGHLHIMMYMYFLSK